MFFSHTNNVKCTIQQYDYESIKQKRPILGIMSHHFHQINMQQQTYSLVFITWLLFNRCHSILTLDKHHENTTNRPFTLDVIKRRNKEIHYDQSSIASNAKCTLLFILINLIYIRTAPEESS